MSESWRRVSGREITAARTQVTPAVESLRVPALPLLVTPSPGAEQLTDLFKTGLCSFVSGADG